VLIADDHSTFLAGLMSIIDMERDLIVVAQATNGREAVDLWHKHSSRRHAARPAHAGARRRRCSRGDSLRRILPRRIVLLTTYDTDNDIYRAIKAGAKGYLLKDARREELLDCIRKVNAGETVYSTSVASKAYRRASTVSL